MPAIRPMRLSDADEIGRLYAQSAAYLRALGDAGDFHFGAEVYRRDGFGDHPAFSGLVAALPGRLAGYLLYTFSYDTDRALRYLFVLDLLVDEPLRGQGIGKALMARAAAVCRAAGGRELFWAVYVQNRAALDFYRALGAQTVDHLSFMRLKL